MTVVIITGGGGFLGQCLCTSLLGDRKICAGSDDVETEISRIILADVAFPPVDKMQSAIAQGVADETVLCRQGSIESAEFCNSLVSEHDESVSIFHLGAVMSGTGEADFDLCMRVNLMGTINVLEAARDHPSRVKFIMASAGAIVGSGEQNDWIKKEDVIKDSVRATPKTTYGATKACSELLLADYSRRSFIDGRGAR